MRVKKPMKKFLIYLIPWILAVVWLIYLLSAPKGNELLSPPETPALIMALVVFILGYMLFLLMMFASDIKEAFLKKKH